MNRHNSASQRFSGTRLVTAAIMLLACAGIAAAAKTPEPRDLPPRKKLYNPPYPNRPVPPFRMIGNIYYVGETNYTSFLISTKQGLILLDTMTNPEAPTIREGVQKLGFNLRDIKILLQTHAHVDHVGGLAKLKELTGAKVLVMEQDKSVLEDGGRSDFRNKEGGELWHPVKADGLLHDGSKVQLGGVTMVAHLTAGHTKGCTTWTMVTEDGGKKYNVVFVCSNRLNDGVPLLNNPKYPDIVAAFENGFKTLKKLPCDVFFASHAYMFNLEEKLKRMREGAKTNPFIDPAGYREYVADYENDFLWQLKQEREGGPPAGSPASAGR